MLDYLDWQSAISLEDVFAGSDGFSHPSMVAGIGTLYLSSLKREKSRSVLMLIPEGELQAVCITPAPFSLQTKVNEYGGKPYWVLGRDVYFANSVDQCLYQLSLDGLNNRPVRVSKPGDASERLMFTDVHRLSDGHLIAVVEKKAEPENTMSISVLNSTESLAPEKLIEGADFYSNLVLNPLASQIAWVQWQHPNMPWDENELWLADVVYEHDGVCLVNAKRIALPSEFGTQACICQLLFAANGHLFFSADFRTTSDSDNLVTPSSADFWNIYAYNVNADKVTQVTTGLAEYGYPHWVYGDHRIVQLDEQRLLVVASEPDGDSLSLIDQTTLNTQALPKQQVTLQHLSSDGHGKATIVKLPYDSNASLLELDFTVTTNAEMFAEKTLTTSTSISENLSLAQHICFATRDDSKAYGFYYPPTNDRYQGQTDECLKPPLLVMVHGGPTARAYGHFDIQKQFWTSRGFAILDVNHRGSSGYGRAYRDALYGEWGEVDTQDIVDGIAYLVERGKADASRVCIRGKSAGGYAVLRALTEYPQIFKVGACYYGIGNLVTLAETTHKFEKYYTDRLLNETFDAKTASQTSSRFFQRSPINKIAKVGSAMIIFQGSLDKVVPPSVAQEVVSALQTADLDYEYIEYPDEAHGFRQVENNIDAWGKELAFYRRVLRANAD